MDRSLSDNPHLLPKLRWITFWALAFLPRLANQLGEAGIFANERNIAAINPKINDEAKLYFQPWENPPK